MDINEVKTIEDLNKWYEQEFKKDISYWSTTSV